jgi:tetratricopeptide (TPR) repeat protein
MKKHLSVAAVALVVLVLVSSCKQEPLCDSGEWGLRMGSGGTIPAEQRRAVATQPSSPTLYDDLGHFHRAITTKSADAQKAFDQGLTLVYAFNHDESIRLFEEAAKADPEAAMPWFGIALANGPHINNPMLAPDRAEAAWKALDKARALAKGATEIEKDLIDALGARYSSKFDAERKPLDEAWAAAMRSLWKSHQDDADAGAIFAEAMMDLRPWDLWTHDGKPQPGTEEIVATLEAVLTMAPEHPGANHLMIHAVEASPTPETGLASANVLRTLVPGAGHLVHMPGHIDIRLGHYADASLANERAIEADRRSAARFPKAGFYRIYMAHNWQFLAFSSMMEGRYETAIKAARAMVAGVPREFLETQAAFIDGFYPIVLHVMIRFGKWEDVLKEPEFAKDLVISNAIRHYARGVALAALSRVEEAEAEQKAFAEAVKLVEADRPFGNNSAREVLGVPEHMLAAEIMFRKGNVDWALNQFRIAAATEDGLRYDEPPDWMQPVRHALGASLLTAKKYDVAEKVFREDLARFPENGWSLLGLSRALRGRGATAEAAEAQRRFDKAWSRADVRISSPCFCQKGE